MLNLFKKNENKDFEPIDEVIKSYYHKLQEDGINTNETHRAGISFPSDVYEFLKLFAKFENKSVSKIVIDMILFILEDKNRFNQFLNEKYAKKL